LVVFLAASPLQGVNAFARVLHLQIQLNKVLLVKNTNNGAKLI
jgi:hypothetical protein